MKKNWFLEKIETSQPFRIGLEILIAIILLSWLPLVTQIIAGLALSIVCEIVFARIMTNNLKNKFSSQAFSEMSKNLEKNKLSR